MSLQRQCCEYSDLEDYPKILLHCKLVDSVSKKLSVLEEKISTIKNFKVLHNLPFTPILHFAAYLGKANLCKLLLEQGHSLTAYTTMGWNIPLIYAIVGDQVECFKILLKCCLEQNVPIKDNNGNKIIHIAAVNGACKIINYLIREEQVNVNIKNQYGRTPLYLATKYDEKDAVDVLLGFGASVDESEGSPDGKTPLHEAISSGRFGIMKTLLSRGADITKTTKRGQSVQHIAAAEGRFSCLNFMYHNYDLDLEAQDSSKQGNTPLHLAALGGHLKTVGWLLYEGVSANLPNGEGTPALFHAIKHTAVVKLLLEIGALVNATKPSFQNITPLHAAILAGNVDAVRLLMQKGADDSIEDSQNKLAPLHWAVKYGQLDCVKMMAKLGSDLRVQSSNEYGNCPIHFAASSTEVASLEFLLDSGISVNERNRHGMTPLHVASYYGNLETVILLINRRAEVNVEAKEPSGCTPLHTSAIHGHTNVMAILLAKGANVDAFTRSDHNTVMHWALAEDHAKCLQLMKDYGANMRVHMDSDKRNSLLITAAKHNAINSTIWLLKNKIPVNFTSALGYTALHEAAKSDHSRLVSILLEAGADINAQHQLTNYKTPLHFAIQYDNEDVVKILLAKGADVTKAIRYGQDPLHFAVIRGALRSLKEMVNHGLSMCDTTRTMDGNLPIHIAAEHGHDHIIEWLVNEVGIPPSICNQYGDTALHLAVRRNSMKTVKFLIENGSEVNTNNSKDMSTPLHTAVSYNNVEMVRLLLENGANIESVAFNKETPLHWAIKFGCFSALVELVRHDADIFKRDVFGITAISNALKRGEWEIYRFLVEAVRDKQICKLSYLYQNLSFSNYALSLGYKETHNGEAGLTTELEFYLHSFPKSNKTDFNLQEEVGLKFSPIHMKKIYRPKFDHSNSKVNDLTSNKSSSKSDDCSNHRTPEESLEEPGLEIPKHKLYRPKFELRNGETKLTSEKSSSESNDCSNHQTPEESQEESELEVPKDKLYGSKFELRNSEVKLTNDKSSSESDDCSNHQTPEESQEGSELEVPKDKLYGPKFELRNSEVKLTSNKSSSESDDCSNHQTPEESQEESELEVPKDKLYGPKFELRNSEVKLTSDKSSSESDDCSNHQTPEESQEESELEVPKDKLYGPKFELRNSEVKLTNDESSSESDDCQNYQTPEESEEESELEAR